MDGLLHNEDVMLLTQRVEQMERSVNRILPIVRKILYTVSERQSTAGEGGPPEHSDSPH
jgi:general secretion pathway protein A